MAARGVRNVGRPVDPDVAVASLAISPTPYDTAWAASVPCDADPGRSHYPQSLRWILAHQNSDGSWGSNANYWFDGVVSTLAAVVAVARFPNERGARAAQRAAERFLATTTRVSHPSGEPVGFELLLPTLIRRALEAGAVVPDRLNAFGGIRARKLAPIPPESLTRADLSTIHSLEFMIDSIPLDELKSAQSSDGSIGNSPAATAAFLERTRDPSAEAYLSGCMELSGNGSLPVLHPCEQFDLIWRLYYLLIGCVPLSEWADQSIGDRLAGWFTDDGVALSATFNVPDVDDTAVAAILLDHLGYPANPEVIERFASDGHYATYGYERGSSVSSNAHALHAIGRLPRYPARLERARMVLDFLARARTDGSHWYDKWHISPYYATAHVLRALRDAPAPPAREARALAIPALRWIEATQQSDGGWGAYEQTTAEESSYAVLAALAWVQDIADGQSRFESALARLDGAADEPTPALWIGKCLYLPPRVVGSAIWAARYAIAGLLARPFTDPPPVSDLVALPNES